METKKTFSFFDNIDKLFHRNIKEDKVIDPPEVYTPLNDCANAILNETIIKTEKDFTMCCLTWNMHGLTPSPKEIDNLLSPHKGFDIYAIGSEECLRSIFQSLFISDKSYWERQLSHYFGDEYIMVSSVTLSAIHLIVFIKAEHENIISNIGSNSVKTGFINMLGNKGGVGIWFYLYNMSFLIINSHLAAGQANSQKRNEDFETILSNMNTKVNFTNFIVFMGDLNYRVEKNIEEAKALVSGKKFQELLQNDQLNIERKNLRLKMNGFLEGKINFNPTFKYIDGSSDFEINSENHIPSWTDRIFYSKKFVTHAVFDIDLDEYNSMNFIEMSDHKPVYSYFTIKIQA